MDVDKNNAASSSRMSSSNTIPLDEVLNRIGLGRFHIGLLLLCGFGFSAAAVEIVLFSFLFVELQHEWQLTPFQLMIIPQVVGLGSLLGETFWGYVADRYGRRNAFVVTSAITACFGVLSAFSPNIFVLAGLRMLVGFGYGGNIAVDFAVYSEFLATRGRGEMLIAMQCFWPLGQIGCCLLAWRLIPVFGWRTFLAACAVPMLFTAVLRPFVPESPRWLIMKGRKEEAAQVVMDMAITNSLKPDDVGLSQGVTLTLEGTTIVSASDSAAAAQHAGGQKDSRVWVGRLFQKPLLMTTLGLLSFGTALECQTFGMSTLMPSLLKRKGFVSSNIYESMTLNAIAGIPGILLAGILSTSIGRLFPLKWCLLCASPALAAFAWVKSSVGIKACTCVACMLTESAWALFHTYLPEAFPTELRATSIGWINALASISSQALNFFVVYLLHVSTIEQAILFFCVVAVCGSAGAGIFLHVETRNRDLADATGACAK